MYVEKEEHVVSVEKEEHVMYVEKPKSVKCLWRHEVQEPLYINRPFFSLHLSLAVNSSKFATVCKVDPAHFHASVYLSTVW